MSQPVCVDQLNPAGFSVFNMSYNENSRFFPARETHAENLKINMAEADLSPTTFTSSSASDSDSDISLRIPLKMKTKIYTLKLPVIIIIRHRKQCQSLKSAGVRRCQSRSTGSSWHPVELIKLLKITCKKWQPVCFRESEEAEGMNKNWEKNCYSHRESELKTTHHERLLRLIYLTVIHLLFKT